jgi:hypothetical protein
MLDLGSLDLQVLLREILSSPCLPLPSPNSNCIPLVAKVRADFSYEARV